MVALSNIYEPLLDQGYLPDFITRRGIRHLLGRKVAQVSAVTPAEKEEYIKSLKEKEAIAINTKEANEQHYEVPSEFFTMCLGKNLKYSCCLFEDGATTLDEAEDKMLELYIARAGMEDGMSVLDVGCGWGSLSLFLAKRFPNSKITGVSNSASQREWIMKMAAERGLTNVEILTADMNTFEMDRTFDRIFSIEMFEHMKNYSALLRKISHWITPTTGRLFVHVFAHHSTPYDFKTQDDNSWMAKYFFTGGTMPCEDLFTYFQEDVEVVERWTVNGRNYARTSEEWLKLLDGNRERAMKVLEGGYGSAQAARMWFNRWRVFYLAVAETFGYNDGNEWPVVHYLFKRRE
ncbi:S-adenosyl-L-methionine-dependent methyltransferase [Fimicolochytrium jonesii]|uniref:S-adenosyl-L-methionine-dependent methyltransferase n=1 Tax=Fimicolochytrium jonesii TaxID=1396493 RepID=UPI0022FF0662|nr:S-adenosyl-L-methionine-dependent methyltransferase [Fimicolochytrium jonesii]KAI8826026.1 S-adenosyl-L-methionine-dependent methyltransferase [Fimicolochytrium jonesii]